MNILIIGNGFDIAHNLPTKYNQFLQYIEDFSLYNNIKKEITFDNSPCILGNRALANIDKNILDHIIDLDTNEKNIFEELSSLIDKNTWINYFTDLHVEINKNDGWIDFEKEISKVIQTLDSIRNERNKTLSEEGSYYLNVNLKENEEEFIKKFFKYTYPSFSPYQMIDNDEFDKYKEILIHDLNRLIRSLEIYLSTYVNSKNANKIKYIDDLKIDKVLSFNYTNTYESVYCLNKNNIDFDFIHGKASILNSIDSNNMVLGIDEYLEEPDKDIDNEYVQFKKFYQRILKMTGAHYTDWLNEFKISKEKTVHVPNTKYELNIYIIGHSLDITDKDILRPILLNDYSNVTIYHHSKKALEDQIINLVKVIGEENLIKRTYGKNQKIKFIPIPVEE